MSFVWLSIRTRTATGS